MKKQKTTNRPMVNETAYTVYTNPCLSEVCTLPEACIMWAMSKSAIKNQFEKHDGVGRLTLTGGVILLSVSEVKKIYGEPIISLEEYRSGKRS